MNNEHPKRKLENVFSALYGEPWAITHQGFNLIASIAEAHAAGSLPDYAIKKKTAMDDGDGNDSEDATDFESEYGFQFTDNNVAIIPVSGPIFPKANIMTRYSGATSLADLSSKIEMAQSLEPSSIILDISSPGGSVSGIFSFCSDLFMMTQRTGGRCPIVGIANDMACSAAYAILSQCDSAWGVDGAIVGSIGVVGQVDDADRYMRNLGVDSTVYTSAGQNKRPMPHQLDRSSPHHDAIQNSIDMYFDKFKEAVSRGRPNVDLNKVATGQVWMANAVNGDSAESLNLIDGVKTLDELIAELGD